MSNGDSRQTPTLGICVVTFERPDFLVRCLRSLAAERSQVGHVVVVDASAAPGHERVESTYPGATYIHAPSLAGWMTRSRNEGLLHIHGDVVAFLDDDVVVRPGWAASVRAAFVDPSIAAVSGRTCNGLPGEEHYDQPVGRLLPNGRLTAGFAAALSGPVEVDHGIGANMAFRRSILAELGGFRDDYPGTALREDTDIFLRIGALGARAVFVPGAAVDHLPAPHVKGARFDTRYKLYGRRNHLVLLARHSGAMSPMVRRWITGQFRDVLSAGGVLRMLQRLAVTVVGVAWGLAVLPWSAGLRPLPPRRSDDASRRIRAALSV